MYWPNVGAYGTSVNLTYPPIWKFQYTCARTNVHACTNVSLDKSILGHKMSSDNFGQKSARTNVSLDNSLLGQKSPWTKVSLDKSPLDNSLPWTIAPWTIVPTPFSVGILMKKGLILSLMASKWPQNSLK